jgi:hypothetical protein
MNPRSHLSLLWIAALAVAGCATNITTDVLQNPAPTEKFSNFTRFEMSKIALPAPYAGQEANEKALAKIQENVSAKMTPLLETWNRSAAPGAPVRTLLIEPTVTDIKFINATSRVWAGAMAGSSAVIIRARISEKETGKVIAEPHFYSRAAAYSGAFSLGGADNAMLIRIATRLSDYLQANYTEAVGGRTGAEPPK